MECTTSMLESVAQEVGTQIAEGVKQGEATDLGDIEKAVQEMVQELGQRCVEEALRQIGKEDVPAESPCRCGEQAQYRCRRPGKVIGLFGRMSYRRAYYVCEGCRQGHYPLDRAFGIRPGQVSPELGKHLAQLGTQTAFGEAQQLAASLLRVEVSPTMVHKETLRFGRLQAQREQEWQAQSQDVQRLEARQRQVAQRPRRLYGSLDGVIAPVDGEWRELKVGCWYHGDAPKSAQRASPDDQTQRAHQLSYYCDFTDAQTFGELLWATGCQRGADVADEVVFVADGAAWIWNLVAEYFPHAVQIVDWYHAAAYLAPVANAAFGKDDPRAHACTQRLKDALWNGQVHHVIQACRRLVQRFPQAAEPAERTITFLSNNAHRMDYARLRQQGYLVGSGTVESGCKQIGAFRLKRAGARWTQEGARLTAKARAAYLSGDWHALAQRRACLPLTA